MFYQEGVKFAFAQLGLTKEAVSPQGFLGAMGGLVGAGRGAVRGSLVGGATGAVLGESGDRWDSALRGAGYGALLGGAGGGISGARSGARIGKANASTIKNYLRNAGKMPPEMDAVSRSLGGVTDPGLGTSALGLLGGVRGTMKPKEP